MAAQQSTAHSGLERSPFDWRFLTPLLLGAVINPVNSSIIATALVGIGRDLHASASSTASLVAGLYLACAIAQPTMGKLARHFGARRIFLLGLVIVAIGGIIGTAAPNLGTLLVSRVLIGIGTSAGYPTAMALIRQRADDSRMGIPGSALGSIAIAGQATVALGLPLGGVIVGLAGWRSTFLLNVPLAIVGIIVTLLWIPEDRRREGPRESMVAAIDPLGIVLFGGAITSLLIFLQGLKSPTWWLVPIVIACSVLLIVWERRAPAPFIDVPMLAKNAPLRRT
ncbi:MAG TPA: MFS transporter, partial [Thermomicrobiales bacterium]|nr:MFS transporter [Thermomicrobiales bacterium]